MAAAAFAAMVAVVCTTSAINSSAAGFVSSIGSHPIPDDHPPGWIAIDKVSNGCGTAGSVFRAHDQTYETEGGQKVTVDFTEACDLHDAAYSGALVWDGINGRFVDFSEPRWTKESIDEKFLHDLQRLCFGAFPDAAGTNAEEALHTCLTSRDVRKNGTWGAFSFYDLVSDSLVGSEPRDRIKLTSQWKNAAVSWPLCDVAGGDPMTIKQNGRVITAGWRHGSGGERGSFKGTLTTGGDEGDDIVVGEYTLTTGQSGPMTIKVISADKLDFNGAGAGGSLVRSDRSTQGSLGSVAAPSCKKGSTSPAGQAPAGAFALVDSLTEIKNAQGEALKIDPSGQTAELDHTGQYGGAGKGGEWRSHYKWKVPRTLVPGKKSSITIGLTVSDVNPKQPLLVSIGALAPDFVGRVDVNYPSPSSKTSSFDYTLAEDLKDSKEILVSIAFESSYVIYHYRHA